MGKQLFTHSGPKVIDMIRRKVERPFLGLRFHDIPHTVANSRRGSSSAMFTIHSMGGYEMMKGAVESSGYIAKQLNTPKPLILAITILTSMDEIVEEIS